MNLARTRARYLTAIGLVLGLPACKEAAPPSANDAGPAAQPSTPATTVSTNPPPPSTVPSVPPHVLSLPTCPNGNFCVAEPAKLTGNAAAAPYGKCALTTTHPEDLTDAGYARPQRQINFSADR